MKIARHNGKLPRIGAFLADRRARPRWRSHPGETARDSPRFFDQDETTTHVKEATLC
ncbi:hypothetical protein NT01EI_1173 [Edwardsiella ictaluri 93-146]|uniref:Uncharacterized protein n=1 Tax=Edwardsiella ictaluri (strain 93-146) TaxID=634503 RepID=C5BHN7_EDWI9|nr:hypothetical protein NT01EI_1173 [Edwardsiella ictaluri 93-146]STP87987.1 Uncharacterised protein [Edwardsiella ictaluri]